MHVNLNLQPVYQNDFVLAQVDSTLKFIFVEWFKHPQSEEFRPIFKKLADLTIKLKITYWLSDAQAIHYLAIGDQNWIVTEIAPLFRNTQLMMFARLTSHTNLELLDAVQIISRVEKLRDLNINTQFELFTGKKEALNWLFSDLNQSVAMDALL